MYIEAVKSNLIPFYVLSCNACKCLSLALLNAPAYPILISFWVLYRYFLQDDVDSMTGHFPHGIAHLVAAYELKEGSAEGNPGLNCGMKDSVFSGRE